MAHEDKERPRSSSECAPGSNPDTPHDGSFSYPSLNGGGILTLDDAKCKSTTSNGTGAGGGGGGSGGGGGTGRKGPSQEWVDAVERALLRVHTDDGERAVRELKRLMEAKAMTETPEQIRFFQRVVNTKLQALARSEEAPVRHACVRAVTALVDTDFADSASRTAQHSFFANFLSRLLNTPDMEQTKLAARALGLIAKANFVLSSVIVDSESDKYLEWLNRQQTDRYYCACVGFQELAKSAPAAIVSRLTRFQKALFVGLGHDLSLCRRAAASALATLLVVGSKEGAPQSAELFSACERALQGDAAAVGAPTLHGVLLVLLAVVGEEAGEDVCDRILDSVMRACCTLSTTAHPAYVRVSAVELMCAVAQHHPAVFSKHSGGATAACISLTRCDEAYECISAVDDAVSELPSGSRVHTAAFLSLSRIIATQCDGVDTIAREVGPEVMAALQSSPPCSGAAACVVALLHASANDSLVAGLLAQLVASADALPLSPFLIRTLLSLCSVRSELSAGLSAMAAERVAAGLRDAAGDETEDACLHALHSLDSCGAPLLAAHAHLLIPPAALIVDHPRSAVRKRAGDAGCLLVVAGHARANGFSGTPARAAAMAEVEALLEAVLRVALADPTAEVRRAVLGSIRRLVVPSCRELLASEACVGYVCASLVDEVSEAREIALDIVASVVHLSRTAEDRMRLLARQVKTELQCPTDAIQQEQAARMLGGLVKASASVVAECDASLSELLIERLQHATSSRFKRALFKTIALLLQSGHTFEPDALSSLVTLAIDIVRGKQCVATSAAASLLTRLLRRGMAVTRIIKNPGLVARVLECLREGEPEVRRAMVVLAGAIGAMDLTTASHMKQLSQPPKVTAPDYGGYVATAGILSILQHPSLAFHRREAVQALHSVLKAFAGIHGARPAQLLQQVVPVVIGLLETCAAAPHHDAALAEALFRALQQAVEMAQGATDTGAENKAAVSRFADVIVKFMKHFWDPREQSETVTIIALAIELHTCIDGMRAHAKWIMPKLIEAARGGLRDDILAAKAVLAFEPLSALVEPFLIPVSSCLLDVAGATDQLPGLRITCMQALGGLCQQGVSMKDVSARLVHALVRVSQGVVTPAADARHNVGAEALHTLCNVAEALGPGFAMFQRSVVKSLEKIPGQEADSVTRFLSGTGAKPPLSPLAARHRINSLSSGSLRRGSTGSLGGGAGASGSVNEQHHMNEPQLRAALTAYAKARTERDYERWLYNLTLELLAQSPKTVLRACAHVGKGHPPLARSLFPPAFSLCYNALGSDDQKLMSKAVQEVLMCPTASISVVSHPLLELCAFVERAYAQHFADSGGRQQVVHKFIPPSKLWTIAEGCQNYPLALYWLESEVYRLEQTGSPDAARWPDSMRKEYLNACKKIVHVNKFLEQTQQAEGVLSIIKRKGVADLITGAETYEDLGWWHKAYEFYENACTTASTEKLPYHVAGMLRCTEHMGDWRAVLALAETWKDNESVRQRTARAVSHAAWMISNWGVLEESVLRMPKMADMPARRPGDCTPGCTAALYKSVLAIKKGDHVRARKLIEASREYLEKDISEHVAKDNGRGYELVVMLQHLSEMEEIMEHKELDEKDKPKRKEELLRVWGTRLRNMRHDPWHLRDVLWLRTLLIGREENAEDWLHYVSSLHNKRQARALKVLLGTERDTLNEQALSEALNRSVNASLVISYVSVLWDIDTDAAARKKLFSQMAQYIPKMCDSAEPEVARNGLVMMAQWKQSMRPRDYWMPPHRESVLDYLKTAMEVQLTGKPSEKTSDYRICHEWALLNLRIAHRDKTLTQEASGDFALSAVKAFVRCIEMCDPPEAATQDVLRLLNLLFAFAGVSAVNQEFRQALKTLPPKYFVPFLPQVLSRIGRKDDALEKIVHEMLVIIARFCPQRVLLSLSVPLKCVVSDDSTRERKRSATAVYAVIRDEHPRMASEVELLTTELVRVAVSWEEKWNESLIEAHKLWQKGNHQGMLAVLGQLHSEMKAPQSELDHAFIKQYDAELTRAQTAWKTWRTTRRDNDINRAWEVYGGFYNRLQRHLKGQTYVFLREVSVPLYEAKDLMTTVPGTGGAVPIAAFNPHLQVMGSKRRPKQLTAIGADGNDYMFLLKGHEDLRLDQRVMQLLELVNSLVKISAGNVSIQSAIPPIETFAVVPLSSTAGLIGWVERAQTIDEIISEMRGRRQDKVREEVEMFTREQHELSRTLTVLQKADALEVTLMNSRTDDLRVYLWLRSGNASEWVEKRAIYTRSAALMSMVGYILGLGDRHPGNLMMNDSGKVVHIDFADCFETAMHRDTFPEKVPFRLTPMMVRAMGVGGVTGTFSLTCRTSMRILRKGKQPLMAMLEAFVHDPIVHSKLNEQTPASNAAATGANAATSSSFTQSLERSGTLEVVGEQRPSPTGSLHAAADTSTSRQSTQSTDEPTPVRKVIRRIQDKLDGTEFLEYSPTETGDPQTLALDVRDQVNKLMRAAQSLENMAQCYTGWCPFW